MANTGGATASAADVDWGPMDRQLHTELMEKKEKKESSGKTYRQMLVSCCVQQQMLVIIFIIIIIIIIYIQHTNFGSSEKYNINY